MSKTDSMHFYTLSDILGLPKSEQEILDSLRHEAPQCCQLYTDMQEQHRRQLMDFLTGKRGLTVTYDVIFKQLMDPYIHRGRLEDFLSAILKQPVKIRSIIPVEGLRQYEADSLVVMDISLELEDGSIIDVEMQKVGYYFPGQRADCYGADFIMRQYNRLRNELGKSFTYRAMKPVILLVIMEQSSKEFSTAAPNYIHRSIQSFDSGASLPTLFQKIFISLDTFHDVVQNINTEEDAWLTFLTSNQPEQIVQLVNQYPQFLSCYQELAQFRKKPKEMITMYSEALAFADRNTARYMIDDQNKQLKAQEQQLTQNRQQLDQQSQQLAQQNQQLEQQGQQLAQQSQQLAQQSQQLEQQGLQLEQKDKQLEQSNQMLADSQSLIAQLKAELEQYKAK